MKVYSEVWTQATFILSFPSADNTNDSVARSWLIIKSERLIHFIPSLSMFIFQPRIRCPNLDLVEGLYSLFVAVGWETSFKIADCLIVIYKLEVFWSCKDSGLSCRHLLILGHGHPCTRINGSFFCLTVPSAHEKSGHR